MEKTEHRTGETEYSANRETWRRPSNGLGCMSYNGVRNLAFIEGNMNALMYIGILQNNLLDRATKLGIKEHFGSSKIMIQSTQPIREWLLHNVPKQLPTPTQSPDVNPIENLWHILDLKIRIRKIRNKNDLKKALLEEW